MMPRSLLLYLPTAASLCKLKIQPLPVETRGLFHKTLGICKWPILTINVHINRDIYNFWPNGRKFWRKKYYRIGPSWDKNCKYFCPTGSTSQKHFDMSFEVTWADWSLNVPTLCFFFHFQVFKNLAFSSIQQGDGSTNCATTTAQTFNVETKLRTLTDSALRKLQLWHQCLFARCISFHLWPNSTLN